MSILQPVIRVKAAISIKIAYMCQFMDYDIYSKYLRYSSTAEGFPDYPEELNHWYAFVFCTNWSKRNSLRTVLQPELTRMP
jgi:hypothetical protein